MDYYDCLLVKDVRNMIGDFCNSPQGVKPTHKDELPTHPDVHNVFYNLTGEMMTTSRKHWHGIDFEFDIITILPDCKGWYVVICAYDEIVVVDSNFSLHSIHSKVRITDIALFPNCQKALMSSKKCWYDLFEFDYISGDMTTHTLDHPFNMVQCQQSGNIITATYDEVNIVSSEYKRMHRFPVPDAQWIKVDAWDQIIVARYEDFSVHSADGKQELCCYKLPYRCYSVSVNMVDGTVCFLDFVHHKLVLFKNKK